MKIYLKNFGCKVNAAELLEAGEFIASHGHDVEEVTSPGEIPADAEGKLIINSCTVTAVADAKLRAFVRRVIRRSPGLEVVVGGCHVRAPHFEPSLLAGAAVVEKVGEYAETLAARGIASRNGDARPAKPAGFSNGKKRHRAFIRVQDGCGSKCSFCIIPLVRPPYSISRGEVLRRVESSLESGVKEIVITGTNIGKFRDEEGCAFTELLEEICERALSSRARVRVSSIEPEDVDERILDLFSHPALSPHLHLPLQSGSPRILGLMRRRYSLKRYLGIAGAMRERYPDASITADIIVGFPGEDDSDFKETLAVMESVGFERVHAFRYSPRPGTASKGLKGVPERVVKERMGELLARSDKIVRRRTMRHVGRTVEVLIEEVSTGIGRGYSGEYLRVQAPVSIEIVGKLASIAIEGIEESGLLAGNLVDADVRAGEPERVSRAK